MGGFCLLYIQGHCLLLLYLPPYSLKNQSVKRLLPKLQWERDRSFEALHELPRSSGKLSADPLIVAFDLSRLK